MYKILGFNRFQSKKGSQCCLLQLARDFSSREIEAGSCGVRVEEVFLPENLFNIAVPENVGKSARLYFNRNGYVDDVVLE